MDQRLYTNSYIVENLFEKDRRKKTEHSWIVTLNSRGGLIKKTLLAKGTHLSVDIHPVEFFRRAVIDRAVYTIAVHNHPSGSLFFSKNDLEVYNKLKESSKVLDIKVLDFLIISEDGWASLVSCLKGRSLFNERSNKADLKILNQ